MRVILGKVQKNASSCKTQNTETPAGIQTSNLKFEQIRDGSESFK